MAHRKLGTSLLTHPSLTFPPGFWTSAPPKWCGSSPFCIGACSPPSFSCWTFSMLRVFTVCFSLDAIAPKRQENELLYCYYYYYFGGLISTEDRGPTMRLSRFRALDFKGFLKLHISPPERLRTPSRGPPVQALPHPSGSSPLPRPKPTIFPADPSPGL